MARFAFMYLTPDKFRLSHLKLEGIGPGTLVHFCPRCDFQYTFKHVGVPYCPKCEASLCIASVTPDLVAMARAAA
jgi:hypothetical protein